MFDAWLSGLRVYRALRGGVWRWLEFNNANGGTGFWTRNVTPENERFVTDREFYSPFDPEQFSDGFHTVGELYWHRHYLYCAFLATRPEAWKSRTHHDGSSYPGWFVAGCELDGRPITYHMPDEIWDLCRAQELERGREFDGHTSDDVCDRLRQHLLATVGQS